MGWLPIVLNSLTEEDLLKLKVERKARKNKLHYKIGL